MIIKKLCRTCDTPKPLDAFRQGESRCRTCRRAYSKARYIAVRDGRGERRCRACGEVLSLVEFAWLGSERSRVCKTCATIARYAPAPPTDRAWRISDLPDAPHPSRVAEIERLEHLARWLDAAVALTRAAQ